MIYTTASCTSSTVSIEYMRCFSMRSTDDGLTWSKPAEITYAFEPFRSLADDGQLLGQ
jgi:hypothetical protein